MQEIFYNGHIVTNNENQDIAKAMIVNEGSVVYVGEDEEVLNLKTEDTAVTNLKEKYLYPTMFEFKDDIFEIITARLKNAKKIKDIQKPEDIDENYENFANYEAYKKEYLKLEKEFMKQGVSTIIFTKIGKVEFAFLKQISEEKCLTLDIVAYVDIVTAKQVMDDNCVTYRKYRNHLRLGGYYLKIDGKIQDLKALLKNHYSGSKTYFGFQETSSEQLYYLMKEALSEKKQILFDVAGDKAIQDVLSVLDDVSEKEKITEFYRPIFYGVGLVDKKIYSKLKHYDITLVFENLEKQEIKKVKRFIGVSRKNKFQNFVSLIKNGIRFVFSSNKLLELGVNNFKNSSFFKKCDFNSKMLKNNKIITNYTTLLYNFIYSNYAYICFDQDKKAILETQKQANFIISEISIFEALRSECQFVENVYIEGEKKY